METALEYYKDCGLHNINCCNNEFQAPGFYENVDLNWNLSGERKPKLTEMSKDAIGYIPIRQTHGKSFIHCMVRVP